MLFTSYEFLLFLICFVSLYYILPAAFRVYCILAGNIIFYYICGPAYIPYIFVTIISTYLSGIYIDKNLSSQKAEIKQLDDPSKEQKKEIKSRYEKKRKACAAAAIILNISILFSVKYTGFFLSSASAATGLSFGAAQGFAEKLIIPMGISFYTFQSVGYIVDVYRGSVKAEKAFVRYASFISFFPLIIQGPISRFPELSKTLYNQDSFEYKNLKYGSCRILWGYFKKLVIADRLAPVIILFTSDTEKYIGFYAVIILFLYTIQLYADFTGGIDITIGIGEMLGIRIAENFNRPYFSKSLKEYWRRWHISMCSWFRDYVFYPVSASKWMQKSGKAVRKMFGDRIGKRFPVYVASFIVWFLTGLWHGASWNFITWGLLNYIILMVSEELEGPAGKLRDKIFGNSGIFNGAYGKFIHKCLCIIRTFVLVCLLNLFDCYTKVGDTVKVIFSMVSPAAWSSPVNVMFAECFAETGLSAAELMIILLSLAAVFTVSMLQRSGSVRDKLFGLRYSLQVVIIFILFSSIIIFGAYGIGYDASQFIYNRF